MAHSTRLRSAPASRALSAPPRLAPSSPHLAWISRPTLGREPRDPPGVQLPRGGSAGEPPRARRLAREGRRSARAGGAHVERAAQVHPGAAVGRVVARLALVPAAVRRGRRDMLALDSPQSSPCIGARQRTPRSFLVGERHGLRCSTASTRSDRCVLGCQRGRINVGLGAQSPQKPVSMHSAWTLTPSPI